MELVNNLVLEKDYNIESKCKDTSGMWFIINNKNDYNKKHTHPGSFFSGAYYVKVPEKGSRIIFEDPLKVRKHECMSLSGYEINVQEGMFILFPSWLEHKVPVNNDENKRIVISFNVNYPRI